MRKRPRNKFRIAFGSCAGGWVEQPIWNAIIESNPDLFISTGDAIYADWDGKSLVPVTESSLRESWDQLAARDGFARLRKTIPVLATWDNHDYGSHQQGASFPLKSRSKEIFLDFWGEPADSARRKRPGIYADYYYGDGQNMLQIILLDTRTFKSDPIIDDRSKDEKQSMGIVGQYRTHTSPDAQLLGEGQWRWLERVLQKPANIRIIVSSTQIIPNEKKMDEWGNFPSDRKNLLSMAGMATGTKLFMTGNVHFGEISKAGDIFEITSSGLTEANINPVYALATNRFRLKNPVIKPNFGLIDIDWAGNVATAQLLDLEGGIAQSVEIEVK